VGIMQVTGNALRDENGNAFYFNGAACYMIPDGGSGSFNGDVPNQCYANRKAIFAYMKTLAINCVRIKVKFANYNSNSPLPQSTVISNIANIVADAKAQGIRTLVGVWDSTGWNDGNVTGNTYTGGYNLFNALAATFKTEPYLMLEVWNEPGVMTWANWRTLMQNSVAHIRGQGYTGPLLLDGTSWAANYDGSSFGTLVTYDATVNQTGLSNLVFANHHYPGSSGSTFNASSWDSSWGSGLGTYCIMSSESGIMNPPTTGQNVNNYTDWGQFVDHMVAKQGSGHRGCLAWVWSWIDTDTLTGNFSSNQSGSPRPPTASLTQLNTYGQAWQSRFWSKAPTSAPPPPPTPTAPTVITTAALSISPVAPASTDTVTVTAQIQTTHLCMPIDLMVVRVLGPGGVSVDYATTVGPVTVGTSVTTLTATGTFAAGTYTYWIAYLRNGIWNNLSPTRTMTVAP
jgi:hypothetical protein